MRRLALIFTLSGVFCVLAALISHALGMRYCFLFGLWGASVSYLLVALSNRALKNRTGWLMMAALAACALGDFFGPGNFEAGVAAFALAHLLFSACFISLGLSRAKLPYAAVVTITVSAMVLYWIHPHLEAGEQPLVWGYAFVIGVMLTTALGLRRHDAAPVILGAAVIFYVSDLFVARWRFVDESSMNAYFCYPLYYTACLMFAWVPRHLTGEHATDAHTETEATSS